MKVTEQKHETTGVTDVEVRGPILDSGLEPVVRMASPVNREVKLPKVIF